MIIQRSMAARCEYSPRARTPTNTNVKADSDVDIAVECQDVEYWVEAENGLHSPGTPYRGSWTPETLRRELIAALRARFPSQVDVNGTVAITVHASTARVDADVVPCFSYVHYMKDGGARQGTKIFRKDGSGFENFPDQQLENRPSEESCDRGCLQEGRKNSEAGRG